MAALTAALSGPGLVVVAGPAGIGKTALVHAAGLPLLGTGRSPRSGTYPGCR